MARIHRKHETYCYLVCFISCNTKAALVSEERVAVLNLIDAHPFAIYGLHTTNNAYQPRPAKSNTWINPASSIEVHFRSPLMHCIPLLSLVTQQHCQSFGPLLNKDKVGVRGVGGGQGPLSTPFFTLHKVLFYFGKMVKIRKEKKNWLIRNKLQPHNSTWY